MNNTTQKLEYNKKIWINFEWWEITWNAGLLSIHEFNKKMWIEELLKKYLSEIRIGNFEHKKPEIIYQKIMRQIQWEVSNNNSVHNKLDPVFLEIHNRKIASAPTCSRLEKMFTFSDAQNLKKIQRILEIYNLKKYSPKEIIIDLDSTYDPSSENLTYSRFNTHYAKNWFSPLLAFNGKNWDLLKWILRPWNYHCSRWAYTFIQDLLDFYYSNWVENIIFRWDSAFSTPFIYELLESEKYQTEWKKALYYIKLKSNASLMKKVEWKWFLWLSTFEEFEYQAKSWSKPRRIIACIDWKRSKNQGSLFPFYSFIVTNDVLLEKEEVFSMYNWRASIENSIEEVKNGFSVDHLSHKKFQVNSTNFQIFMLTIQLVQLFRKFTMSKKSKTEKQKENLKIQDSKKNTRKFKKRKLWRKEIILPAISTMRKQLFSIPARIVQSGRTIIYKCASSFKYQDLFKNVLRKVQSLQPLII